MLDPQRQNWTASTGPSPSLRTTIAGEGTARPGPRAAKCWRPWAPAEALTSCAGTWCCTTRSSPATNRPRSTACRRCTRPNSGATIAHLEGAGAVGTGQAALVRIGIVAMGISAVVIVLALLQRRRKSGNCSGPGWKLQDTENQRLQEQLDHKRRELTEGPAPGPEEQTVSGVWSRTSNSCATVAKVPEWRSSPASIRFDQQIDQNWDQFNPGLHRTRRDFFRQLTDQHPDLTGTNCGSWPC